MFQEGATNASFWVSLFCTEKEKRGIIVALHAELCPRFSSLCRISPSHAKLCQFFAPLCQVVPSCARAFPLYAEIRQVVPALFPFMPKFAKLCQYFAPLCQVVPSCAHALPLHAIHVDNFAHPCLSCSLFLKYINIIKLFIRSWLRILLCPTLRSLLFCTQPQKDFMALRNLNHVETVGDIEVTFFPPQPYQCPCSSSLVSKGNLTRHIHGRKGGKGCRNIERILRNNLEETGSFACEKYSAKYLAKTTPAMVC